MILQKDDLKAIVDIITPLIDARAKTTETVLKAEIKSEVRNSAERIKKELREEILAARAEAKLDSVTLQGKIDKVLKDHKKRIETLEETTGISHKN
ncbi:MAG TPA: hypothetical protein VLG12_01250 [Candidatus Saccharimonadales bacterium]|nr:hypothetical protein [Candidatus Saccharimonadales bacterium]